MLIPLFKYGKKCYTLKGLFYPIALLEHSFHANRVFLAVAPISYYAIIQWQQLSPLLLKKEYIYQPASLTVPSEQPPMTNYRKRPLRVAKNRPHTIDNEETASLLAWLECYPFMRQKPKAWFNRHKFSQAELKATAQAGFADVALALGYQHHTPLKVNSTPMIISIAPQPDVIERAA
jgi:hypothetical protein